jgi:hypothetical protein
LKDISFSFTLLSELKNLVLRSKVKATSSFQATDLPVAQVEPHGTMQASLKKPFPQDPEAGRHGRSTSRSAKFG